MTAFYKTHKTALNIIFYFTVIFPIVFIAALILRYGVNVPTFDQWELVSYFQKFDAHTLTLTDIIAQHNEHRIAFPRIIMLGAGYFTNWNLVAEMMISLGIQVLSFILIWKAIRRTVKGEAAKVYIVIASLVMFNPMQWENWLWGWQIQWYLTILGMITALYFCWYLPLKRRPLNHVIAITAATVATFSLAGGLVTWVLLLVLLAIRKQAIALGLYTVAFLTNAAVYLHNYHSVTGHTPITAMFNNQLEFFRYLCLYVGGAISNHHQIAPIAGAIIIGSFLVLSIKAILEKQKAAYFWIALGTFVLINAAMTGSGRFLLGPEQALASRYTSISLLLLLSVVMLVGPHIQKIVSRSTPWLQPITICGVIIISGMFALTSLGGIGHARSTSQRQQTASDCLNKQAAPNSACFILVYPTSAENDKRNTIYLEFLRDEHLAGRR